MAPGPLLMEAPDVMIDIARDFHAYPVGRKPEDGDYNGTRFREEILAPKLRDALVRNRHLTIILDGVRTFGSSFLEEAFGGLVRVDHFSAEEVNRAIIVIYKRPYMEAYEKLIRRYIQEAQPE